MKICPNPATICNDDACGHLLRNGLKGGNSYGYGHEHPGSGKFVAARVCRELEARLSGLAEEQRQSVRRAYHVGAEAHAGQQRQSGEDYITHPVAVATILADLGMDAETIVAAILHDTLEDTGLTREGLSDQFGVTVADLVEGVTKLDKVRFGSRQEATAESFRKMLLAVARDLRVILIELATPAQHAHPGCHAARSRRRISRETLEIYAPIAQRLGMNLIKAELQDLGFRNLYPDRYRIIAGRIRDMLGNRREVIERIEADITMRLADEGIKARVIGRIKSPYSIYKKMRSENKTFDQVTGCLRLSRGDIRCASRLHGPGKCARLVQAGRQALQGLHCHSQGQRLPVPAHGIVRPLRRTHRSTDPNRKHGHGGQAGRGRTPGLQDG